MNTVLCKCLILLLSTTALAGCSTIFGDRYNHVEIMSEPVAATFTVRNGAGAVVASGSTPNTIKLKSSAGYFKRGRYSVVFSAPGYVDQTADLVASMRGIYWGNILVGGPIGLLIVDPASGAMWALPRALDAKLTPAPGGAVTALATPGAEPSTTPALSKDQQLQELQHQNLSYEDYQRRHKEIMNSQ